MKRRTLPQTLVNQITKMLEEAHLNVLNFKWDVVVGPWAKEFEVSRLTHEPSGFFMLFDVARSGHYHPSGWPGTWWPDRHTANLDATDVLGLARTWIANVSVEAEAPDLWKVAVEQASLRLDPSAFDNTPFTEEEQNRIGEVLFNLEDLVYRSEPALPPEKRVAVAGTFRYLKKGLTYLGRYDWKNILMSQLVQLAFNKLIGSDTFNVLRSQVVDQFWSIGSVVTKLLGG